MFFFFSTYIKCSDVSYADEIKALKNDTLVAGGDRSWLYQTCTEFGFYQTCDPGSGCIFTSQPHLNTLQSNFDMCEEVFNVSATTTEQRIRFSNNFYGGDKPLGAARIMYPNGKIDPWHAASIVPPSVDPVNLPALMVAGASHHFWTHPEKSTDAPEIVKARQTIKSQVKAWLAEFPTGATPSPSPPPPGSTTHGLSPSQAVLVSIGSFVLGGVVLLSISRFCFQKNRQNGDYDAHHLNEYSSI